MVCVVFRKVQEDLHHVVPQCSFDEVTQDADDHFPSVSESLSYQRVLDKIPASCRLLPVPAVIQQFPLVLPRVRPKKFQQGFKR